MEGNTNHQPDNEETVREDDIVERFEGHRSFHEIDHNLRQFPLVPDVVKKHVGHPCVVDWCHLRLFPSNPIAVPKCHVDHKKDGLEVWVTAIVRGGQNRMVRA